MSKSTVTRIFVGSAIALIAGAVVMIAVVWIAIANDVFIQQGPNDFAVQGSALAWSLLGPGILAGLAMTAGAVGGFVAWIGALLNTSQLESKTWFLVLLLLGLFSFGFFAMIAYVIAGPDGLGEDARHPAPTPA
jgi:hypothetical protein